MSWRVVVGDILDQRADVLVCSANPYLTLSGGVGGAFMVRYGQEMQERLQAYLEERGVRHVPPGTVVRMPPCGSDYVAVLHAVAVNAAYESSPELVTEVVEQTLDIVEELGAHSVALPALATGYGHMTLEQFRDGLAPLVSRRRASADVLVCIRHREDIDLLEPLM